MIARKFGPLMGGLFLAFPAIFPAGATLIKKHEKEKKDRAGCRGRRDGKHRPAGVCMHPVEVSAGTRDLARAYPGHNRMDHCRHGHLARL